MLFAIFLAFSESFGVFRRGIVRSKKEPRWGWLYQLASPNGASTKSYQKDHNMNRKIIGSFMSLIVAIGCTIATAAVSPSP